MLIKFELNVLMGFDLGYFEEFKILLIFWVVFGKIIVKCENLERIWKWKENENMILERNECC